MPDFGQKNTGRFFNLRQNLEHHDVEEPADGLVFAFWQTYTEFFETIDPGSTRNQIAVTPGRADFHDLAYVVLVSDLADQFLGDVFEGHQPGNASVFVNRNGEMNPFGTHHLHDR